MIKRITKMKKNLKKVYRRFLYTYYYDTLELKDDMIIFESYLGADLSGNPYYLLLETLKRKDINNVYVSANKDNLKKVKRFLEEKNLITEVTLVEKNSLKYRRILAEAKFLVNNSTFPSFYIKKEGQIYLNTWHGTPLKTLGKSRNSEIATIGNMQRNFLMSDYIIYPNEFTYNKMINDFMLTKGENTKHFVSGYPRNAIFKDIKFQKETKRALKLNEKKVIVYMPTYRGLSSNFVDKNDIEEYLKELDGLLAKDTIFYVKLHSLISAQLNFDCFENIKPFPQQFETYEFLSIADILVTDYSSVFFDFANTKRKIVLFTYDKEDYLRDRGMYLDIEELPFPQVDNIKNLASELTKPNDFNDYSDFLKNYCQYDSLKTTSNVYDMFYKSRTKNLKLMNQEKNDRKENVLIFRGSLPQNGITTAMNNLLNNVDLKGKNYFISLYASKVKKRKAELLNLPKDVDYIPMMGKLNSRLAEYIIYRIYLKTNLQINFVEKIISRMFKREIRRLYTGINFDYVIHFTGYDSKMIHLLSEMDSQKTIFVRNDLVLEYNEKKNCHKPSLIKAYNSYDFIAIVHEHLRASLKQWGVDTSKVLPVPNIHDYEKVLKKAEDSFILDDNTKVNFENDKVYEAYSKDAVKIINIGRFSKEKGHFRLIDAFTEAQAKNIDKKMQLWILGGYGALYEETVDYAGKSKYSDSIFIIKSLSNPYPLLKKMNLFVMSSEYEGFPNVIIESLILKIPVVSTSIPGVKEFLEQGYGYLVENSKEGLEYGIQKYLNGELKESNFDFIKHNKFAKSQFATLVKDGD